ncbi:isochorismate synthase [Volucribacter psittacicida]|uniref:Isochorismate synthase MenF n=1 Tax=Volucribacter psittacicida TaxID=203482 RepID=A0A4R1FXB0_9PAST|nr:isochorismate synthase [Volucribacter psittacicida]TCJ98402.1 isochorismate synthase [Volucribacter psittacicida]
MDSLQQLKSKIADILAQYQPNPTPRIRAFKAQITSSIPLLSWLKAQAIYPQFYFKQRDQEVTFAAIGKVRSFSDKFLAQAFMDQYGFPLVGGIQFEGNTFFFLPQLLLQQQQDKLDCWLFIDEQIPLAQQFEPLMATIAHCQPLQRIEHIKMIDQYCQASFNQWQSWIKQGLQGFKQGELSKVVLANQYHLTADRSINGKDMLWQSEQVNPHCYHFLLAENEDCTFLGSSPERLYRREQQQLNTEALAGTAFMDKDQAKNQQQAHWLLQDPKNQYENQLVVDGICQHLSPYAQHIEVKPTALVRLRNVQHLCRKIQVVLKPDCYDVHCLQAIHPTPAVAGLPQQQARDFIKNCENFHRTWYAGCLGVMQPQQAEFCVTIRSAFVEHNKIRVFAGAGIVEGSDPLLEWQEIERKAKGLISLFNQT